MLTRPASDTEWFANSYSTSLLSTRPPIDTDRFNKGHAMSYHIYVKVHVKDHQLSVVKVGRCVPV